jgi:hypothetical protein
MEAVMGDTKGFVTLPRAEWDRLRDALDGIEHFSDALNFRSDALSRSLREFIAEADRAVTVIDSLVPKGGGTDAL